MKNVIKIYSESYKQHGDSLKSIFIPKGRQKERFDSLTNYCINNKDLKLLDFGCGLGHLSFYLLESFPNIQYYGCDIVLDFIEHCQKKNPNSFFFHIDNYENITESYDYIIAAGVFNLLYYPEIEKHKFIVFETIKHIFNKTKKVLSINFMNDNVDFISDNAYHQNILEIINFTIKNLSKRFVIDQSYMPFEFTLHIFKDDNIIRPENIFNHYE